MSDPLNLKKHIRSVHEGLKPFKCDICISLFASKAKLKSHVASVHYKEKPFKCDFCEANFSNKPNFISELR